MKQASKIAPISSRSSDIFNSEAQVNLKAMIMECGEKIKILLRQGRHASSSGSSAKACFNDKRGRKLIPPKFARLIDWIQWEVMMRETLFWNTLGIRIYPIPLEDHGGFDLSLCCVCVVRVMWEKENGLSFAAVGEIYGFCPFLLLIFSFFWFWLWFSRRLVATKIRKRLIVNTDYRYSLPTIYNDYYLFLFF